MEALKTEVPFFVFWAGLIHAVHLRAVYSIWAMEDWDSLDDVGTGENEQKFPKSTESKLRYSKGI